MSTPSNHLLFEGTPLPDRIHWLELLTYIVPNMSEEVRDWTLDLHYALGRNRTAPSKEIIAHLAEIRAALSENEAQILRELAQRLPEENPSDLIRDWIDGLNLIEQIATSKSQCSWTRSASKQEQTRAGEALVFLLEQFEKAQPTTEAEQRKHDLLKEKIRTADPATKMRLLTAALDALNKK